MIEQATTAVNEAHSETLAGKRWHFAAAGNRYNGVTGPGRGDAMSLFEFLMILLSIIVGLGLAEILTGVGRILREGRQSDFSWIHSALVAAVFFWIAADFLGELEPALYRGVDIPRDAVDALVANPASDDRTYTVSDPVGA